MPNQYDIYEYEDEIDVRDLFFSILRHWRAILAGALILGILLGGGKTMMGLKNLHDPEYIATVQKENEQKLHTYEVLLENYIKQASEIENAIKIEEGFCNRSIRMQLNPYNVYRETALYYVSTDYKVLPELTYQNLDTTLPILNAYKSLINDCNYSIPKEIVYGGYIDEDILQENLENDNLKVFDEVKAAGRLYNSNALNQLITVSVDSNNYTLKITTMADSEELASALMDAAKKRVADTKESVEKSIGAHEVNLVETEKSVTVDTGLIKEQNDSQSRIQSLQKSLADINNQMSKLEKPSGELLSKRKVFKSGIKFGILGAGAGVFGVCALLFLLYVLGGVIHTVEEFKLRYGESILGVLPKAGPAQMTVIDHMIRKADEGIGKNNTEKDIYSLISTAIGNYAEADSRILLVGTVEDQDFQKVSENINVDSLGLKMESAGNIVKDEKALRSLKNADSVVLVEKRNKSRVLDVSQEIDVIRKMGLKTIGIIVL